MPMQPRPRTETVRGAVRPRVRVVSSVMAPANSFECTRSQASSGCRRELALVDADLVVDRAQVRGDLDELRLDPLAVRLEQGEPLGLVALAAADQVGVPAYVADRHACRAKPGDQ